MADQTAQDVTPQATAEPEEQVEQTTEAESSPVEQTGDESQGESQETQAEGTESAEGAQSEETEGDEESKPDETLAPKSANRFQKLANENRELRDRLAQMEQFQVPSEEDYVQGGYEPTEAKLNAIQAQMQQRDAIERVERLNLTVDNDMARILTEYPQLNPKSKEFKEELARGLFEQYDEDSGAEYGEGGVVLRANQLPYQYIKKKMDLISKASAQERVTAQRNVERMVAAADTPSSKAPPADNTDDSKLNATQYAEKYGLKRVRD